MLETTKICPPESDRNAFCSNGGKKKKKPTTLMRVSLFIRGGTNRYCFISFLRISQLLPRILELLICLQNSYDFIRQKLLDLKFMVM